MSQSTVAQGPLKKWTEHSQELHLLKIHSRGLLLHPGAGWGLTFWTMSYYKKFISNTDLILQAKGELVPTPTFEANKTYLYQDLSNEGSNFFLSSLESIHQAAQTQAFLDKFKIMAGLNRAQNKHSSEFTEFSTKT
jgi:hypothetical protein